MVPAKIRGNGNISHWYLLIVTSNHYMLNQYGNPAFTQQVGLGCRGWVAAHVDRGQPLCFQGLNQIQSGWFCWVMAAVSAGSQKKSNPKSGHEFDLTKYGSVSLQRLVCPGKTEGMSVPPHLCGHTKHYDRKCLKWKWDFTARGLKRTFAIFANLWVYRFKKNQQVFIQTLRFWKCL